MPRTQAIGLQIIDPVLTNVARHYKSHGFIGEGLLTNVPVATLTGQYPIFDKQYWFANDVTRIKADRAPTREIDFEWDTETYRCEEYALKVSISDLERQQAHAAIKLEANKVALLSHRMSIAREIEIASILTRVSDGGEIPDANASQPSVNWDQDTATIEADIKAGILAVYDATGLLPNTLVLPYKVAYAMAVQADIREIIKYTQPTGEQVLRLGAGILPGVLHGLRVVVAQGAQSTTDNEADPSLSINEIWGDDVRILHVGAGGYGLPATLYRFQHTAPTVTRWRQTDPDVEYIRELERYDLKCVAPDTAYIIRDVLS